ncbi:MAG: hypothetical protein DWP97_09210 [Calditrichaeota bacterium]|nr:MAG: hypothetical protein DWP97_09210 [Calditrichota bacterium]
MNETKTVKVNKPKKPMMWLIYVSLALSGLVLLADAYSIYPLAKWTAKLGIALVYSAFALVVGNGRKSGYTAAAIIVVAVLATFVI